MPAVRSTVLRLVCALCFLSIHPAIARAQSADSLDTGVTNARLPVNHSPSRALRRALVLPGGGQLYNRQYWKLPIVYAGLGVMTWRSIQANQNHKLYTRAFQYKDWQDEVDAGRAETHPFPEFEDEYEQVLIEQCEGTCTASANELEQIRDNFRRNRDLSRFGIGLIYGLSIIDAFVSAHLLDFDVGEDLTVQFLPHPNGATAHLRIGF
ncbi:MAG: DUF5683 domain-containing protein [Bacteroidota bacterium]